jgi:ribosomal protein S6--L-glutamate ligase
MRLVSFNALRSLDIHGAHPIKPELYFREIATVNGADWILFPEYWQVNSLVYGLKKRIFPSIAAYHLGHDKIEQSRAFMSVAPNHVPWTEILPNTEASINHALECFSFPFVAKEVRSSMGNGVFMIESRRDLLHYAAQNAVLYLQEYLPISRDLRVVWIGNQIVTAYWREQGDGFHFNVAKGGVLNFDLIPPAALALVRDVATRLGIDHAGFDIAVVAGHCYLLEFNLFFGLDGLNRQGLRSGHYVQCYLQAQEDDPGNPHRPHPCPRPVAA